MSVFSLAVIAGILSLGIIFWLMRGRQHGMDRLASQIRPIDVTAFRNLIDDNEREFLHSHLRPAEFRSIHRERMLAAAEYVWCAFRNAGILVRLAEVSVDDPDTAVAEAAASLHQNATQLRLHTMRTLPKIYLSMVLPTLNWSPAELPDGFDRLNRQAVILGCLQVPAQ